jgi:phosphotransferase system enzyme I (PtsI)
MPAREEFHGRRASPGSIAGPLVHIGGRPGLIDWTRASFSADDVAGAMRATERELTALAGRVDRSLAGIVEFQLELLAMDLTGTEGGERAGSPIERWRGAIAKLAREFESSGDETLAARAVDLTDVMERLERHLIGAVGHLAVSIPAGGIVVAADVMPSALIEWHWPERAGIVTSGGGINGHAAILARARGIPMLVGTYPLPGAAHREAVLLADEGRLIASPLEADRMLVPAGTPARPAAVPAAKGGAGRISVMINIDGLGDLAGLDPASCDGIGLVRTEFLFRGRDQPPGEDEQLAAYRRVLEWAGERPVTIRTMDAGGDKALPWIGRLEKNPALGLRGLRLSLARPEVFRIQVRALLRAAAIRPFGVMFPMVAIPAEVERARALVQAELHALRGARVPAGDVQIGMMVEVPAAALTLDLFDVAFASIGTNDLVQHVFAADREAPDLIGLDEAEAPAVQRLIAIAVESAARRGLPLAVCGDAAADPAVLPALLTSGIRSVSVAPAALSRVRQAIETWRQGR